MGCYGAIVPPSEHERAGQPGADEHERADRAADDHHVERVARAPRHGGDDGGGDDSAGDDSGGDDGVGGDSAGDGRGDGLGDGLGDGFGDDDVGHDDEDVRGERAEPSEGADEEPGVWRRAWRCGRSIVGRYVDEDVPLLSAGIAFYAILSVSPIFVILLFVAGLFMDEDAARASVLRRLRDHLGPEAATLLERALDARVLEGGGIATVIALAVFLVAATRLFASLQTALDRVWRREGDPAESRWDQLRARALGLLLVVLVGVLLVLGVGVKVGVELLARRMGLDGVPFGWRLLDYALSVALFTPVVVFVFRRFPTVTVRRRYVWTGALATTALLLAGGQLVGLYVTQVAAKSSFGAAGALVAFVLWIYYAAQAFLFGALVTRSLAGDAVEPRAVSSIVRGGRHLRRRWRERRADPPPGTHA